MAGLSKENPFKDVFNKRVIDELGERILSNYNDFDKDGFVNTCVVPLEALGFLERCHHIRDVLGQYLPKDYVEAVQILIASLGDDLENPGTTDWDSFIVMPQTAFVSKYGQGHYDQSMKALYEMTKRFSAENDLRTFLALNYDKTMSILYKWTKDPSPHVRRLVSEGTRQRLPLAGRIRRFQEAPQPLIDLLSELIQDESLYVRRSVANNMNDIAKDHPELVIETFKKWQRTPSKDTQWIIQHGGRYLIKQGNLEMLSLLGYKQSNDIKLKQLSIEKSLYHVNDPLEMTIILKNEGDDTLALMIDYVIHYVKANGDTKEKVFKIKKCSIKGGQTIEFVKKHVLKNTSGRQHYAGVHMIELQINGQRYGELAFELQTQA